MTKELEERLVSFAKTVAKGCDVCPRRHSSCCVGCYGEEAKAIVRDLNFKPWTDELDERAISIMSKLDDTKFMTCSVVAKDCGMNTGVFARAAARLAKLGIAEVKGKWIRKTQIK